MLSEDNDETNIIVPKKLYICCPVCSKQLLQVESIRGGIIKCHGCRRHLIIDAENGKVTTTVLITKK